MMVDRYVQRFLNRVALVLAGAATLSLLHLFYHTTLSCSPPAGSHSAAHRSIPNNTQLPRTSCDAASRDLLTPDKRFLKLRSSQPWLRRVHDFSNLFSLLRQADLLRNSSHVLCVSAGAGHEVAALTASGVADVTGVDLVDFPPLVSRADPHNLPFFDSVFDLGFSTGLDGALFPVRFVAEIERTVRRGGAEVLAVGAGEKPEEFVNMFRRSTLLGVTNVTLAGSPMMLIMMRNNGSPS